MLHPALEADRAQARYRELLCEAAQQRLVGELRAGQPTLAARFLLALGDLLIRCGLGLQARSSQSLHAVLGCAAELGRGGGPVQRRQREEVLAQALSAGAAS